MPRRPNPHADPVRIYARKYASGTTVWIIKYYPTGLISRPGDRRQLPGTFGTLKAAEEAADLLRNRLSEHVAVHRTDLRPCERVLRIVVGMYTEEIDGDESIPKGTRNAAKSRLEVALRQSNAWTKPVRELPRHAQSILLEVDESRTEKGKAKEEVTRSGSRTALTNFGQWLVKRGFLEQDPFAPDKETAEQRVVARKAARRREATERARQATPVRNEGDTDTGIGIKDVPRISVVVALRDAVVRRASGNHLARRQSGRGSKGGHKVDPELAEQVAQSVLVRAFAGLRTCEALALHSSRISDDGYEISVDRQFDRYNRWLPDQSVGELMVPPKYDKTRVAVVWPDFVPRLLELKAHAEETSEGWLFPRTQGQKWWVDAYENLIAGAIELLNVEHGAGVNDVATGGIIPAWTWPPHFLRHVYGSYSLAAQDVGGLGWSLQLVSESLGHADTRTTERIYVHPTRSEREIIRSRTLGIEGV